LLVQILFASCRNLHSECSEFFTFIFSDSTGWCSLVFPISVVVILLTLVKGNCVSDIEPVQ
ncbi:hypothetical protein T4A_12009, partial [Trichinella pseudospiralis]